MAMLLVVFWRCLVRNSARAPLIPIDVDRNFLQSIQANERVVPQSGHGRFLPNSSQFIIHESPYQRAPFYIIRAGSASKYLARNEVSNDVPLDVQCLIYPPWNADVPEASCCMVWSCKGLMFGRKLIHVHY